MLAGALNLNNVIIGSLKKSFQTSKLSDDEWDKAEIMLAIPRPFKIASV